VQPELTIAHAAAMREQWLAAWPAAGDAAVDLSKVDEIDSAGVQLLLSARRSLRARGDTLRLLGASPVVQGALGLLGLSALIDAHGSAEAAP